MSLLENNPFSLQGKTILVTGASSGIGRAIAILCSQMGANMVITARNPKRLEETLSMMHGSGHLMIEADLTDEKQREALIAKMPKLNGIVHNAGVGSRILCKNIEYPDIEQVFNPNTFAPMLLQKSLLENKKVEKSTSIVFIASMAPEFPSVGNAVYSASKGAVIAYSKVLAVELAPRLIRVNCISPSMVWTDLITRDGLDQQILEEDQKKYPLKRYGTPQDVANLSVFLLSDASSWMTGSNIELTGGVTNSNPIS